MPVTYLTPRIPRTVVSDETREKMDALISRAKKGSSDAEDAIARQTLPGVTFLLRKWGAGNASADLAQETFITALERLRVGKINTGGELVQFMRVTAKYKLSNERRKATNTERTNVDRLIARLPDPTAHPSIKRSREQMQSAIREAISNVRPKHHAEILHKRYVLQRGKTSLCREYEMTGPQFDRLTYNARMRLKALLVERFGVERFGEFPFLGLEGEFDG